MPLLCSLIWNRLASSVLLLVLLNLESVVAGGSPARDRMEQTWIDIPAGGEGEMLLQRGADPGLANQQSGESPVSLAVAGGHQPSNPLASTDPVIRDAEQEVAQEVLTLLDACRATGRPLILTTDANAISSHSSVQLTTSTTAVPPQTPPLNCSQ